MVDMNKKKALKSIVEGQFRVIKKSPNRDFSPMGNYDDSEQARRDARKIGLLHAERSEGQIPTYYVVDASGQVVYPEGAES